MELSIDELVRRTDLEEETVRDVVKILEAEFEDNGNDTEEDDSDDNDEIEESTDNQTDAEDENSDKEEIK